MIKEVIILAGGFGTRLQPVISDLPKCMALVAGKPFLNYVLSHLQKQGIEKFIFSLGYKSEIIRQYVQSEFPNINYIFSEENIPLGTGGAIKVACSQAIHRNVLVVNGDTLFLVNVKELGAFHKMCNADCTLSLKPMRNFNRYGAVELNNDFSIKSFEEKKFYRTGLINGGVYILNVDKFSNENLPETFSFEKNYLEKYFDKRRMFGRVQDEYFIDIGTPEDYQKAMEELKSIT